MLIEPFLGISEQWLLGPPNESVWFFTIGPVVDETDNFRRRKTLDDKEGNITCEKMDLIRLSTYLGYRAKAKVANPCARNNSLKVAPALRPYPG